MVRKALTYLFLSWLMAVAAISGLNAQVLAPPQMQCLQVASGGDVTIQWLSPSDPTNVFTQYEIFFSTTQNGPYSSLVTLASISSQAYTHSTILPISTDVFYYIVTHSTAGVSVPSDTVRTMHLSAVPSVLPQGYAFLNWNSPFLPGTAVPTGTSYEVWREYPTGSWTMVGTLPFGVTLWNYEISVCSAFMNFQIRLNIPGYCEFRSNIDGDTFQDLVPPAIPVVSSVEVEHISNDAVITWLPSTSQDTQGYILYKCTNGVVSLVDTIWGINNTQFTDILANTSIGPVSYLLAAFDTCYTGFPPSPNTSPTSNICNKSVYLNTVPYAICDDQITINWTAYEGWDLGVESYVIYHAFAQAPLPSVGSLVFTPIDTVPGSQNSYVHNGILLDGYNIYYVDAIANVTGFNSHSNMRFVLTPYPTPPDYIYLSSASVVGQNAIEVQVAIDPTPFVHEFTLQRKEISGNGWDEVTVQTAVSQPGLVFSNNTSISTDVFSYSYRVITTNQCLDVVDTTNLGTTILLFGLANADRAVNVLSWSAYGEWEQGVEKYLVHRRIGNQGPDEVIAELSNASPYFEDDVSQMPYTEGKFCYTIEAVERPSQEVGVSHSSFSNEVCISQEPVIWIPNAFVVDGVNTNFKPVISFADFNQYQMLIYSRWGDVIYETNDIDAPWDGTMKGELVKEGAYPYYISVKDGKGKLYERVGTVIMLTLRER